MKITDHTLAILDLIEIEFSNRLASHHSPEFVIDDENDVLGVSEDDLPDLLKCSFGRGANCQAAVTPTQVVKWYWNQKEPAHKTASVDNDAAMYSLACQMGHGQHFARSMNIGRYTIQERIIPYAEWQCDNKKLTDGRKMTIAKKLVDISFDMMIGDLHDQNWGFRVSDKNGRCPVIFDWSDDSFNGHVGLQLFNYYTDSYTKLNKYIKDRLCQWQVASGRNQAPWNRDYGDSTNEWTR